MRGAALDGSFRAIYIKGEDILQSDPGTTGAGRVIRMYRTAPPGSASRLYAREPGAMAIRDVLCEDRFAVGSGQRGLASGAIGTVRMQDHEMLLRHRYETVQERAAA